MLNRINESIQILVIFLLGIIVNYFISNQLFNIYLYILLIISLFSKDNIYWFAAILYFIEAPGDLFNNDLPVIGFIRDLKFFEIWSLLLIFKLSFYINKKHKSKFYLNNILLVLFIYFILLLLFSLYNIELLKIARSIRLIIPWFLIYYVYYIFNNRNDLYRFLKLLIPIVILTFISQIYIIITGSAIANTLGGGTRVLSTFYGVRELYGMDINFIFIFLALLLFFDKQIIFNKNIYVYLLLVSVFNIFITATRGWSIGVTVMLIPLILLGVNRKIISFLGVLIVFIFTVIVLSISIPTLNKQFSMVMERFNTIEYLIKGDTSAGGTLSRLDDRGPKVINKFIESPLFGWGFTSNFYDYSDVHTGFQTTLLNGGIVGLILILLLFFNFLFVNIKKYIKADSSQPYIVIVFAFLGLIAIHASSEILFSYFTLNWHLIKVTFIIGVSGLYNNKKYI